MNYYISYFYQVRNMKPNMLPVSTAMWDPRWFHNFKGHLHRYIDNNGVINGIRMNQLCMEMYRWERLVKDKISCMECNNFIPGECPFMQEYAKYIREKNPDFQKFLTFCEGYINFLNQSHGSAIDTIIFIVHEPPTRDCGERQELQRWFKENGYDLLEWRIES